MIFIDRTTVETPEILTVKKLGRSKGGLLEREQAIDHYTKDQSPDGAFDFKVYRRDDVKTPLKKLFNEKCAYCESSLKGNQPGDVEHFRPKSTYFWLAATWENLLLACKFCNTPHKQKVPGEPKKVTIGKGDKFPLEKLIPDEDDALTESRRLQLQDDDVTVEPRLLIDPCVDDPNLHLDFKNGEGGLVRGLSLQGVESIRVYALQRQGLVEERLEKLKLLISQIKRVFESIEEYAEDRSDPNLEELNQNMFEAFSFCVAEKEFSGMCKQFFDEFIKSIKQGEKFDEAVARIPGAKKALESSRAKMEGPIGEMVADLIAEIPF